MKIVEIKTYSPVYPVKDPFSNAMRTTRERAFGVVEVVTDAGITGWGEGATVPARRALDTQVIGRNPFDYEVIWEALHKAGTDPAGISAVDIALWDIMARRSSSRSTSCWAARSARACRPMQQDSFVVNVPTGRPRWWRRRAATWTKASRP